MQLVSIFSVNSRKDCSKRKWDKKNHFPLLSKGGKCSLPSYTHPIHKSYSCSYSANHSDFPFLIVNNSCETKHVVFKMPSFCNCFLSIQTALFLQRLWRGMAFITHNPLWAVLLALPSLLPTLYKSLLML